MLFVEGAGQALIEKGYLQGPVSITAKGIGEYDQLLASGWRPQRDIVRRVLQDKGVPAGHLELVTELIMQVTEV